MRSLYTKNKIYKNEIICNYPGKIYKGKIARNYIKKKEDEEDKDTAFMMISKFNDTLYCIDAVDIDNQIYGRNINYSIEKCDCKSISYINDGMYMVLIKATTDIPMNEEIYLNYNDTRSGRVSWLSK